MSILALDPGELIKAARRIRKDAFVPSQGAAATDPAAAAMGGGAPPTPGGDPAAMGGGAPPMDPAAMGGGAPPMDPAAMGGGAPPMDPTMGAGGAGGAVDPTTMPAPDGSMPFAQAGAGGGGSGGSGKGGKGNNDEVLKCQQLVQQCINETRMTRDLILDMMEQQGMKINPATLRSGMAAADNVVNPQAAAPMAAGAM